MKKLLVLFSLTTSQLFAASVGYWQIPLNLNASQLTSGTVPTNVLPGALPTLSTWNGGGVLTNLAFPQTYWFTNVGTTNWTIPTGTRSLFIEAVGHGGAGASGRRGAAGSVRSGGSGGGGGTYSHRLLPNVSLLYTNFLVIVIPAVPAGGSSVTTDNSNGTNGASGNNTFVYVGAAANTNWILRASPGGAGNGGDADGSTGGTAGAQGTFAGSAGGASSTTGLLGTAGSSTSVGYGASGGGGGGGITTGDVTSFGGAGGNGPQAFFTATASPGGGSPGVDGTNIISANISLNLVTALTGWPGAGGGGSQTNAPAGHGADGYGWGSGGGGGGASLNGYASGRGGNGGPAAVCITAY